MAPDQNFNHYGVLPNVRPSGNLELHLRCLVRFQRAVLSELRSRTGLPLKQRVKAWKQGFSSKAWVLYRLQENDARQYLPDLASAGKSYRINGFSNPIIGNKLVLSRLLHAHDIPHPEVVSVIHKGKLMAENGPIRDQGIKQTLLDTLQHHPHQVFRPSWSGGGEGVFFLDRIDGELQLNGHEISADEVCNLLSRLDRYLATAFVDQAEYARSIYAGSTNTMRFLSLWDVDRNEPFIAAVSHRFGSSRSAPIDNWHQGRGGICAAVDAQTSTLGPAWRLGQDDQPVCESSHYETGEQVEGVSVPGFGDCLEGVLTAARHLPFCPCIGWDAVITPTGFSILEANPLPGMPVLQVHTPLLKDPRVRKFYRQFGMAS